MKIGPLAWPADQFMRWCREPRPFCLPVRTTTRSTRLVADRMFMRSTTQSWLEKYLPKAQTLCPTKFDSSKALAECQTKMGKKVVNFLHTHPRIPLESSPWSPGGPLWNGPQGARHQNNPRNGRKTLKIARKNDAAGSPLAPSVTRRVGNQHPSPKVPIHPTIGFIGG